MPVSTAKRIPVAISNLSPVVSAPSGGSPVKIAGFFQNSIANRDYSDYFVEKFIFRLQKREIPPIFMPEPERRETEDEF